MRETDITFQGLNFTPYGDASPDGQLELCVGLEMHNGSLRPSVICGTESIIPDTHSGITLHSLHSTNEYSHFIFLSADRKNIYWSDQTEGTLSIQPIQDTALVNPVNSIKAVGNTLVVMSSDGIHYCLFKDGTYKYIGQKPPETVIQFTLVSERYVVSYETPSLVPHKDIVNGNYSDNLYTNTDYMELKEEPAEVLSLSENALASRLVSEAAESGRIVYPVLVRYAYRLYDDTSYVMQSSPVLLVPNTDVAPVSVYRAGSNIIGAAIHSMANVSLVSYNILSSELDDWKDIISSVDIFMTEQIYSRNLDSKITHVIRFSNSDGGKSRNYGIFSLLPSHLGPKTLYQSWSEEGNTENDSQGYMFSFHGEKMKNHDFLSKISEASVFFKVRSISLDEIETGKDTYIFDEESPTAVTLQNLVFQETLPDDWQSHDTLVPSTSYTYNKRLNIASYQRILFGGYSPSAMMPLVQADYGSGHCTIYTHLRKGASEIVVKNSSDGIEGFYPMYLFYPDADAYKMTIIKDDDPQPGVVYYGYVVTLQPHPFLNGSYWFGNFADASAIRKNISPPSVTPSSVRYDNSIATSAVDNPFIFPLSGRKTVGIGNIVGLASIVTPLSQGQFGTFDLMILTDEGNYAATVTDEGTYSTVKPMQRDVCINPGSVTPAERELIYISGKGVMVADGNSITCISSALDGVPDDFYGNSDIIPSRFFKDCLIGYDYIGSRIIFGSPVSQYAYIRSSDGTWSTAKWGPFSAIVNVYPYTYVQRGSLICKLDKPYPYSSDVEYEALLCTRALKMGSIQRKKIHRLSVEGSPLQDKELLLWGSNDGKEWAFIGESSRREIVRVPGRSFKYWRIALSVKITGRQNITGFRIRLEDSQERRFR